MTWTYTGDGSGGNLPDTDSQQRTYEIFKPDFFLILARSRRQTTVPTGDLSMPQMTDADTYGRYQATQVNGSDARVCFLLWLVYRFE